MSDLENAFASHVKLAGLPEPKREFSPIPGRKFRFDFAWPDFRLLVEIQGATWTKGAHSTGTGIERDTEKLNLATIYGYRVMQFTGKQIHSGKALAWTLMFFDVEEAMEGDMAYLRQVIGYHVEECDLSLSMDALDRIEKRFAALKVAA